MKNTPTGDIILRPLRPRNKIELIVNKELTPFLFEEIGQLVFIL
jgi:hypothetical protein